MTRLSSDLPEPTVSCCVIARGRLDHLRRVLVGLDRQTRPLDDVVVVSIGDPEVVAVAESSPIVTTVTSIEHVPGDPLPLAGARNRGADRATGDLLVFLDVDCIPASRLVADYVTQRQSGLLMGSVRYLPPSVPGSIQDWTEDELRRHGRPHPARPLPDRAVQTDRYELFWSLNFATDRATWLSLGGFDQGYRGYGGEDTDLAFEARRRSIPAWFVAGAESFHQHHVVDDPPIDHLRDIVSNARRFRRKWNCWPMTGWLEAFNDQGLVRWDEESLEIVEGVVSR